MLPVVTHQVNEWRHPSRHAKLPDGYYSALDISWTKPEVFMPFRYDKSYSMEGDGGECFIFPYGMGEGWESQNDDASEFAMDESEDGGDEDDDDPDGIPAPAEATPPEFDGLEGGEASDEHSDEFEEDEEEPGAVGEEEDEDVDLSEEDRRWDLLHPPLTHDQQERQKNIATLTSLRSELNIMGHSNYGIVTLQWNNPIIFPVHTWPPGDRPTAG